MKTCSKCHNRYDRENSSRLIPADRKCCKCQNTKSAGNWYTVNVEQDLYQCSKCYRRETRHKRDTVTDPKEYGKLVLNQIRKGNLLPELDLQK
jgi:hypothetical protein